MKVVCPSCETKFGVSDDLVRDKIVKFRCKKCGGAIRVDGTATTSFQALTSLANMSVTPPPLSLADQLPPSIFPPPVAAPGDDEAPPDSVTAFAVAETEPEPPTVQKPPVRQSARPPAPSIKPSVRPPAPKASAKVTEDLDQEPAPISDHSPLSELGPAPLDLATSLNPPPLPIAQEPSAPSQPAPAKPAAPAPAPVGNRLGPWIGLAGIVALALSLWTTFRPQPSAESAGAAQPAAPPAATPAPVAVAPPPAAIPIPIDAASQPPLYVSADAAPAAAATAQASAANAPATATAGSATETPYDEAPAAAPKPRPAASAPTLAAAIAEAVEPAAKAKEPAAPPPEGAKAAPAEPESPPTDEPETPFSREAAIAALENSARLAASCKTASSPTGLARLSITFAPSGRVTAAVVDGPPFAGTPEGSCIASKFRAATIPRFSGGNVIVHRSFDL
jgi:predicted Zn finger-like uncharacterized protein